ncbi:MAG TPA: hypothetical protein VNX88_08740 [Terriglobales bacterium]|jgi:hypothetical protein|nr:hypothetical protein [Terriglobales bacterium]
MSTKTLFLIGIIFVALGLLSFVVKVPHAEQAQFQSGSITLGVSGTEPRRFRWELEEHLLLVGWR